MKINIFVYFKNMGGILCKLGKKKDESIVKPNQIQTNEIIDNENEENKPTEHQYENLSDEEKVINDIVERYLHNNLINCRFIPDVVERKLYRNVLKMIIGILEDTLEKTEIHVLGHKINFSITPISENIEEEDHNKKHVFTINPNFIKEPLNEGNNENTYRNQDGLNYDPNFPF